MRSFVIAVACLVVVGQIAWAAVTSRHEADWMAYKLKHGKSYTSQAEDASRMANFLASKQRVERHNAQSNGSFKMGLSHLSDWTQQELAELNGLKLDKSTLIKARKNLEESEAYLAKILGSSSEPVPDELDWRKVPGRVSEVKNQGQCGSCWAFSAVGALEGQELNHAINKSIEFIGLSEQELVDCSKSNGGCNGGLPWTAFADLNEIGGIESEDDYPYKAHDRKCVFKKEKVVMTDTGYVMLPTDETKVKETLAKFGPISIGIEATPNLVHYKSGVFTDEACRGNLNHGVLLVGYGTDPNEGDFWIVKNSWSDKWGDAGYFKIKRGVNMCGMAEASSIPKF